MSALSRRRGTKTSKRNLVPFAVGGVALLVIGFVGFALIGFVSNGGGLENAKGITDPSSVKKATRDITNKVISSLRKRKVKTKPKDRKTPNNIKEAKQYFMEHEVEIGTSGAFPYYPTSPKVAEDHDFTTWTAPGGKRFEEYKQGDSPYEYSPNESDVLARSRRYHVKKAMEHAWGGYEKYAFGQDELLPVSKGAKEKWGGFGTTLVDSLDTLWLMGMKEEFYRARDWVKTRLNHNIDRDCSVFETTIRSLGGLLSAYDWSQDEAFLDQAKDLGARLFKAFDTTTGFPTQAVNMRTGGKASAGWLGRNIILSEFTSVQLEFRNLARFSGNRDYKTKTEKIFEVLQKMNVKDGIYPIYIRPEGTDVVAGNDKITFGAMGDSCYEYLLKMWIQGGKTEQRYRKMYDKAIQGMHDKLLAVSMPSELVFIADKNNGRMDYKMDHLVCFMGGLLALGAYTDPLGLDSPRAQRDLKTGKALTYTCYQMYARMETGISPEYVQFSEGYDFVAGANHYLLRPETVESFFILYQLTGDPVYREWGWEVFQSIERYCKTQVGYGELSNVRNVDMAPRNSMESFFLAETIKYLYLLFDPETPIDLLHKHVFNTEAHPTRIFPVMDQDGTMDLLKQ